MKWSEDDVIKGVQRLAVELGRVPATNDIRQCKYLPSVGTILKKFNNINNLLESSSFKVNREFKSDNELIQDLKDFYIKYDKVPTVTDTHGSNELASAFTYRRRLGSWNNALKRADLVLNKYHWSKEELIDMLVQSFQKNKISPKCTDKEYTTLTTIFINHFGSWNNALKAANLPINSIKQFKTKPELINELKEYYKLYNRSPRNLDIKSELWMSCGTTYKNYFGSWNNALKAAQLSPNSTYGTIISYEDNTFNSIFELNNYILLNKYFTNIDLHKKYPNSNYINDFYIPEYKLWIEVTSFNESFKYWDTYISKINEKRQIVEAQGDQFLFIQKDIKILEGLLKAAFDK